MPDEINLVKISDLPAATSPGEYDVLAGVQTGDTKQFSFGTLLQWIKNILRPADIGAVPVERTVNNKSLVQNITLTASDVGAVDTDDVGIAGGVASLDGSGKVPSSQLPEIPTSAEDVSYDNTQSGLSADDVQGAIDELASGAGSVDPSTIAPVEDTTTATTAHPIGTIFYLGDVLYRALADIPIGGTINTAAGGNAVQTSVAQNFKRVVTLTAAEYAQLSAAEKAADIVYIITNEAAAASDIDYDHTASGLNADDVQEAIDELAAGAVSVDLSTIAPVEDSTTAAQAHPLGTIFYLEDLLYRALADIAVGDIINTGAGGNATQTTVAQNFKRTVTLTAAEYAQLSAAEKAADIVYIVTDDNTVAASDVTYDPTTSGMSATTVQEAVDELAVAVEARYTATVIYNTLTNVSSDTTITMDEDFTAYKFLMIILNTRSPASASYRIPLVVSTNSIPQGGFYPIINPDGSGYVRINYVSGQTKQVRFQATDLSALYVASISGLR